MTNYEKIKQLLDMVVYNMVEVVDKNQTRTVDDILLEMMDS